MALGQTCEEMLLSEVYKMTKPAFRSEVHMFGKSESRGFPIDHVQCVFCMAEHNSVHKSSVQCGELQCVTNHSGPMTLQPYILRP